MEQRLPEESEPVSLRGMIIKPLGVTGDGPLCSLWGDKHSLDAVVIYSNLGIHFSVCVHAWWGDLSSDGALVRRKCSRVL